MTNSKTISAIAAIFVALTMTSGSAMAEGDAEAGKKIWKKCKACHIVGDKIKKKSGPHLNDLIGRTAGTIEGFRYSKTMKSAGEEGLVWDEETLHTFLTKPKSMIKKTKMSFKGLSDEEDRANIIAYVAQFSEGADIEADSDPDVAPEILAIVGDVDYGQYLSGTCVACHRADGGDDGIPSITGFPQESFVTIVHAYKNKNRENPAMQQVAGSLSNEEIAALAAYFESQ